MNRRDRRRAAKLAGRDWRDEAPIRKLEANSERLEAAALRLPPEVAREMLARWAAQRGHSQAEVDALNAGSQMLDKQKPNDILREGN